MSHDALPTRLPARNDILALQSRDPMMPCRQVLRETVDADGYCTLCGAHLATHAPPPNMSEVYAGACDNPLCTKRTGRNIPCTWVPMSTQSGTDCAYCLCHVNEHHSAHTVFAAAPPTNTATANASTTNATMANATAAHATTANASTSVGTNVDTPLPLPPPMPAASSTQDTMAPPVQISPAALAIQQAVGPAHGFPSPSSTSTGGRPRLTTMNIGTIRVYNERVLQASHLNGGTAVPGFVANIKLTTVEPISLSDRNSALSKIIERIVHHLHVPVPREAVRYFQKQPGGGGTVLVHDPLEVQIERVRFGNRQHGWTIAVYIPGYNRTSTGPQQPPAPQHPLEAQAHHSALATAAGATPPAPGSPTGQVDPLAHPLHATMTLPAPGITHDVGALVAVNSSYASVAGPCLAHLDGHDIAIPRDQDGHPARSVLMQYAKWVHAAGTSSTRKFLISINMDTGTDYMDELRLLFDYMVTYPLAKLAKRRLPVPPHTSIGINVLLSSSAPDRIDGVDVGGPSRMLARNCWLIIMSRILNFGIPVIQDTPLHRFGPEVDSCVATMVLVGRFIGLCAASHMPGPNAFPVTIARLLVYGWDPSTDAVMDAVLSSGKVERTIADVFGSPTCAELVARMIHCMEALDTLETDAAIVKITGQSVYDAAVHQGGIQAGLLAVKRWAFNTMFPTCHNALVAIRTGLLDSQLLAYAANKHRMQDVVAFLTPSRFAGNPDLAHIIRIDKAPDEIIEPSDKSVVDIIRRWVESDERSEAQLKRFLMFRLAHDDLSLALSLPIKVNVCTAGPDSEGRPPQDLTVKAQTCSSTLYIVLGEVFYDQVFEGFAGQDTPPAAAYTVLEDAFGENMRLLLDVVETQDLLFAE